LLLGHLPLAEGKLAGPTPRVASGGIDWLKGGLRKPMNNRDLPHTLLNHSETSWKALGDLHKAILGTNGV